MPDRALTILQLSHQGGPAGSTQSIFNLSQYLARRGHRVLVGCREDVLLRALPAVERPLVLVLVGVPPAAPLQALAAAVPPRHRVVFVPPTDRPLAFYHLATAAALPSRIEGLSQSLLEAMALALPVVASDAGGNPDLVTSDATGLLVPPRDPAAWARALSRVLGDAELARRLGTAGRALVRRDFTLERSAERTEAVYREAVAAR